MTSKPKSHSTSSAFKVSASEEGCHYEYRVYYLDLLTEVRGWTKSANKISVAFLNKRKGGPGSGNYIFYVRAVDPAGNRDFDFIEGQNMHIWYYRNPLNWALIMGCGSTGFIVLFGMYM